MAPKIISWSWPVSPMTLPHFFVRVWWVWFLPTIAGLSCGAIYVHRGTHDFDLYVEPLMFNATYTHAAVVLDRSMVASVDPSYLRPNEDWYLLSSSLWVKGIYISPLHRPLDDPLVVSSFVRETPSIDRERWIRVIRRMMGGHYDRLAALTMKNRSKPDPLYFELLRLNSYTCSSSVAYLLESVGCARFPNWRNAIPPDFADDATFGTVGCGYSPMRRISS